MPEQFRFLVLFASCWIAACDSDHVTAASSLSLNASAVSAYLTSSVADPLAGTDVLIAARVAPTQRSVDAASFGLVVTYDSASLVFTRDASGDDGLRALNATQRGILRVAGARPAGFANGQLVVLQFRVRRRGALSTLQLGVGQLGSVAFDDQTRALNIAPGVRVIR